MNRIVTLALSSFTFAAAVASFAPSAHARSVGAIHGHSHIPSDIGCFQESFGGVKNICTSQKTYLLPMVVEESKWYTPTFGVSVPNISTHITCESFGVSWDRVSNWTSPQVSNNVAGSSQVSPGAAFVPGGGTLYGACWLDPNAEISSINW